MDFVQFCKDEKIYTNILKEYKSILIKANSSQKNHSPINSYKPPVKEEKGFYGNPKIIPKDDFEKFEMPRYKEVDPYNEKSGPFTFCDKCDGKVNEDLFKSLRKKNKEKPSPKPHIPEHLLGRIPPRDLSNFNIPSETITDPDLKIVLYKIVVKTNAALGSGTSAPVFIRLVDKNKKSDPIELKKNVGSLKFYFAPNTEEIFYVKNMEVSDLTGVNIKLDAEKDDDEWNPDWISIEEMSGQKRKWNCKIGKFLSSMKTGCDLVMKLKPIRDRVPIIKYSVLVAISPESVSECFGLLYVKLFGSLRKTNQLLLENAKVKLKKDSKVTFMVEHEEVGDLKELCVGILKYINPNESRNQFATFPNKKEKSPPATQRKGWEDIKIDNVIIEWTDSKGKHHKVKFIMDTWIGYSDKMTRNFVILKTFSDLIKKEKNKNSGKNTETVENTTYDVTFFTGKNILGGTDATVYMKLYGKKEFWSKDYEFIDNDKKRFERGSEDSFIITGPNVGSITQIKIWHDNKGVASGWRLDKVIVKRHFTPSEICEVLEKMKKDMNLPKEIELVDGKVFPKENISQNKNRTAQNEVFKPNSQFIKSKNKRQAVKDLKENNSDSDEENYTPSKILNKKQKENKSHNENFTQTINLPYAEETRFDCSQWLSEDKGKKSLKQKLNAQSSKLLCSPINLKLNPDN